MLQSSSPSAPTAKPVSHWMLIRRLCRLAWRYRGDVCLVLVLNLLLISLNLAGLGFVGIGIDVLRHAVAESSPAAQWPGGWSRPTEWSVTTVITFVAVMIVVLAVVHTGLKYWTAVMSAHLSQKMLRQLRAEVYDQLQRLSFRFFDQNDSSGVIGRVAGDVQAVRAFVDGVVLKVLTVALSLGMYTVYMASLHLPLTIACLATSPLLWVGAVWFSRTVRPLYVRSSELGDHLIGRLAENAQGISVVKGFAQEDREVERFASSNAALRDQKAEIFRRISLFQPVMGGLTQINQLVLIGYGGYLVIQQELPLGAGLFVFANLIQEFAAQVGQIVNIANSVQASLTAAERVYEVLDAPVEIRDAEPAIALPRAQGRIRFDHVSFAYRPGEPVLDDVTFEVAPGECLGIVGETGAGKSTLLALVARFYDVTSGGVSLDGHDVRQLKLSDVRRNLGMVFQESFLFSNTVSNNIAFGRPAAPPAAIQAAAELAAAHDFIAELPDGYHNLVGEHGTNLSGGQRQRLAIARALLLDPPILLLDDATAAVDVETEHEIQTAIARSLHGRTSLMVSSRVSALKRADRVIVLHQGRIIEQGTPQQLLEQRGAYWRLARAQLLDDDSADDEFLPSGSLSSSDSLPRSRTSTASTGPRERSS
jgi:ABC-type multidrug transport system fused ATPase/permease subunit